MNINFITSLKAFDLFQHLSAAELQLISADFVLEEFPDHAIIINEGEIGDKIYFLTEGSAEVFLINKEGKETIVAHFNKGHYFGELALLIDGVRNSSVRALSKCQLLSLQKENFLKILRAYPSVSIGLNSLLSLRLAQTLQLMSIKQDNMLILLITADECKARVQHFIRYFQKISSKPVAIIDNPISEAELVNMKKAKDNNCFLIISTSRPLPSFLTHSHHVINFIEEKPEQIYLGKNASDWKIENSIRKILKKTIGISLCSGGAPGAAEIGVLKVLKAEGIPLDYIVGTSIGSIIGGGFAFGYPMEKLEDKFYGLNNQSAFSSLAMLLANLSLRFSGILRTGFYRKILTSIFDDKIMEEALIPFSAMTSDLYSGKSFIISSGKVVDALIASNSAPVLFEPYKLGSRLLIDGIATDPLPMDILCEQNIDIKIAVPIPQLDLAVSISDKSKLLAVYIRSRSMMAEQITLKSSEMADVIIRPNVSGMNMNDWKNLEKIIVAGEDAAKIALKRIRTLFDSKGSK